MQLLVGGGGGVGGGPLATGSNTCTSMIVMMSIDWTFVNLLFCTKKKKQQRSSLNAETIVGDI